MKIGFVTNFIKGHTKPLYDRIFSEPDIDFKVGTYGEALEFLKQIRNLPEQSIPYELPISDFFEWGQEGLDVLVAPLYEFSLESIRRIKPKICFLCTERPFKEKPGIK